MMDNTYEGKRNIKIELVCTCGNVSKFPSGSFSGGHHSDGVVGISTGMVYICNQCGKEMTRRITKIVTKITETILEEN